MGKKRQERLVLVELVPGRFVKMYRKDAEVVLKERERARDKMRGRETSNVKRETSNVKREDVVRETETSNVKREEPEEFEYPVEEEVVVVRPRRRKRELGIEN